MVVGDGALVGVRVLDGVGALLRLGVLVGLEVLLFGFEDRPAVL
ncbi:MAG: hypothetical protein WAL64_07430 [Candidatus Dormiibacterota bacterium]